MSRTTMLATKAFITIGCVFQRAMRGAGMIFLLIVVGRAQALSAAPDGQYIREWLVAGPLEGSLDGFGGKAFQIHLGDSRPREGELFAVDKNNTVPWQAYTAQDMVIDFAPLLGERTSGVFVAYCTIACAAPAEAMLWISNSEEMPLAVYAAGEWRSFPKGPQGIVLDNQGVKISLSAGESPVFVCGQCTDPRGRFAVRLEAIGAPSPVLTVPLLRTGVLAGFHLRPNPVRYRIGDNPAWSLPASSDADWDQLPPAGDHSLCLPMGSGEEVIWYRFRVRLAPGSADVPVVMTMQPYDDAADVFINGFPIGRPQFIRAPWPDFPRPWFFSGEEALIAVRWDRGRASEDTRGGGFHLILRGFQDALHAYASGHVTESKYSLHRLLLMTIFGVLLVFHATMSFYLPARREYQWFCLALSAAFLAIFFLHISDTTPLVHTWHIAYGKLFSGFTILTLLFGLGLLQNVMIGRVARTFYVYGALAAGLYWMALRDIDYAFFFGLLVLPEALRVQYAALKARRPGVTLFLALTALLLLLVLLHSLGTIYAWPETSGFMRYSSWYGFALFALMVALLLARDFSSASKQLEAFAGQLDAKVKQRTAELEHALVNIKTLSGLLPICSSCKKIRDDDGYWRQIEAYISSHSEAVFTHGICPDCAEKLYPSVNQRKHDSTG